MGEAGRAQGPRVGVIALVPDSWGAIWAARHHVLSRLAESFHVAWIEPHLSWGELLAAPEPSAVESKVRSRPRDFHVCRSTPWLPKFYRPAWLGSRTFGARLRRARRMLLRHGCEKIVLYIWRPDYEPALRAVPHDLSCYHIDDEYSFSSVELPPDEREQRLIRSVDQVFVHSPALLAKKGNLNPNTGVVPNGVDYQAYCGPAPEPGDLASVPRPRIGYSGFVKRQLDWPLITSLVESNRNWQFVFVGEQDSAPETATAVARLERSGNAHFLGAKTVWELAAYPQHFDVCLMPYKRDDYTKYIYPMKLHEYLASGRPVVGTRIRSLEEFSDVVALADDQAAWQQGIADALDPLERGEQRTAARQAVARRNDWATQVERVTGTILRRLGLGGDGIAPPGEAAASSPVSS